MIVVNGLVLPPGMVTGASVAMQALFAEIAATVSSRLDVLLTGETGTGKELFARIVHASGPTSGGPFIAVNCAAIPGELLEAELFGVERNVATGVDPRPGLFLAADGGAMLLDEIAELPERLQAKLLRVLQEREVLSIGAKRPRTISVRIISATNRHLPALVAAGLFRADLYYRLRGLEFHIPPLRDRIEDIAPLSLALVERAAGEYGKVIHGLTDGALDLLRSHSWPGNVRELQSEIRRAALLCPDGGTIDATHFAGLKTLRGGEDVHADIPAPATMTLRERIAFIEKVEIERALLASGGNRSRAARMLGITRNGLTHKLRRLGVEVAE